MMKRHSIFKTGKSEGCKNALLRTMPKRFCRYPVSKLLEILFVRELVKHTEKVPVITMVNPGFCKSELGRDGAPFLAAIKILRLFLARSTEVGSRTLFAGACAGPGSHG